MYNARPGRSRLAEELRFRNVLLCDTIRVLLIGSEQL